MKVVAIAGGISSGKSMVCSTIEQLGGHFVGVDGLSKNLMDPHSSPSCFDQVVKEFGKEILNNNKIDKCRLGQVLFKTNGFNRIKRIIMPSLFEIVSNEIEQCRSRNYQYVFVEVPLTYLTELSSLFDEIVLVVTTRQVERVMKDEKISEKEAIAIVNSLGIAEDYLNLATRTITNENGIDDLKDQVNELLRQLGWSDVY